MAKTLMPAKVRAPRNRTVTLSSEEMLLYRQRLFRPPGQQLDIGRIQNRTINEDLFQILDFLPQSFVDLLFIDPPYNLTKSFNARTFRQLTTEEYQAWLESWLPKLLKTLKPTGSVYICGDWRSSGAIQLTMEKHLVLRNRITWEREKGRGAKKNWKNCCEDIWFGTFSNNYTFNLDAVKLKRRVLAPYTDNVGKPKDWQRSENGNYRMTHPSNLWTDVTVPFWSMPENTDHPTQKPEKLLAKIIAASSLPGDLILDPFAGSGTTSIVAKKLSRKYVGIEIDEGYCCLAEKRLALADKDKTIQGYADGVFWERNSLQQQQVFLRGSKKHDLGPLFGMTTKTGA